MENLFKILLFIPLFLGQIVTNFESKEQKLIAITFDACETVTPAYFDKELQNFILDNKIKATFFLSGKFIERNRDQVKELKKYSFIEIENHSYSHNNFKKMQTKEIIADVLRNEKLIEESVGIKPVFFRFPYGECDVSTVKIIENLGYKVVHWTFPSGDPDKKLTKEALIKGVLNNVKPGNILIFHINQRGWKTKEALPEIIKTLKEKGYNFVMLKEVLSHDDSKKQQGK